MNISWTILQNTTSFFRLFSCWLVCGYNGSNSGSHLGPCRLWDALLRWWQNTVVEVSAGPGPGSSDLFYMRQRYIHTHTHIHIHTYIYTQAMWQSLLFFSSELNLNLPRSLKKCVMAEISDAIFQSEILVTQSIMTFKS